ncbi:MAG TPA: DUF3467 domain-containing protein [Candidatus Binataceae bacterium]|nr:DUF3467 domain-containing protein [Candidatus Binataceae bacterium]
MPDSPPLEVQVNWDESRGMPIAFSNVFLIQQTPSEFFLTFGVVEPPFISTVAPTPEQIEKLKREGVKAKPIIRIAITPQRMVELLQLVQGQLAQFQTTQTH